MSWRTNPVVIALRDLGRAVRINDGIASHVSDRSYEAAYATALINAVRPGDVVWDIGANAGYYTKKLSAKVGSNGAVVACEPSPENFQRLVGACRSLDNVTLLQCGLGRTTGTGRLRQGTDPLGATSCIVPSDSHGIDVELRSGASLLESPGVKPPNSIKIDVEGYELEVVEGLAPILDNGSVRVVACEVHFRILRARGLSTAPRQIERLLQSTGFSIRWPDNSHFLAERSVQ